MIIKGNARCSASFWASHLVRTDHNERVTLAEIRGLSGETVRDCLRELGAIAEGTRTKNGFYVASLNPCEAETLTPDQWEKAADILEAQLGLTGQARFIVEHEKDGRTHRHVVWSRIDPETMKAIPADFNYQKHERAAREIEREFHLEPVESVLVKDRESPRREKRQKDWEGFRDAEKGIDKQTMRREVTALWQEADSGLAFRAALEEAGYLLARGDRRDYCVVDTSGREHSLSRLIDGAKAADIRTRLADIDRDSLPGVAEARQTARDAAAEGNAISEPPEATAQPDAGKSPEGNSFAAALGEVQEGGAFPPVADAARRHAETLEEGFEASARGDFLARPVGWKERLRAWRDAFVDLVRDDSSGGEPKHGPAVTQLLEKGWRKLSGALFTDRLAEDAARAEEEERARAEALARLEAAAPPEEPPHGHHPPDEHHGDPSRPRAVVEALEPDDFRPQKSENPPAAGKATLRDLFARVEDWLADYGGVGDAGGDPAQDAEEWAELPGEAPEPDGWDIEP